MVVTGDYPKLSLPVGTDGATITTGTTTACSGTITVSYSMGMCNPVRCTYTDVAPVKKRKKKKGAPIPESMLGGFHGRKY